MKQVIYKILAIASVLAILTATTLQAQTIIVQDEFDNGEGLWSGWIDGSTATVTTSIDNSGVLSGANSYKLDIAVGGDVSYKIQRNTSCPLLAGNQYKVSFMAVANKDVACNVLFELEGSPYTKYLNELATITTTAQTFTFVMQSSEAVPTNQLKLHFGGPENDSSIVWIDAVMVTEEADPTLISQWGISNYGYWPILNDASTPAGSAVLGGDAGSGWRSLAGGFDALEATTSEAVVVTGKLEYVGGGMADNAYTPIRYALTFQDSSVLENALTDSAAWSRGNSGHTGYAFHPQTDAGDLSNGGGGAGNVWTINDGNWVSTWSNHGAPIAVAHQQPRNAKMIEGVYNFAISVISINDTTVELSWYLVEENNKYWFGGTVQDSARTTKFNQVIFGLDQFEGTEFKVSGVSAKMGQPIVVPEAPWSAYYVDQWGIADYNADWTVTNDTTTLVGDAGITGESKSGWRSLQGGFGQDVEITTDKALVLKGQIEFAGGAPSENAYTPIRYALTWQDSNSTLENALTDSAKWSHNGNHFGYGFHPRTGAGDLSNGGGGAGNVWSINDGNWVSTWSNHGGPLATVYQAPRNAHMTEGKYNFAISVISIDDTTNELSWYLIHEDNTYWFGGTSQVVSTTKKFNSIIFGIDQFEGTAFNVIAMKIDKGEPITVPEAPWSSYYVDQWGLSAEYNTNWPILNDSTTLVGDASMGGEVMSGWRALQGGFGQDVDITTEKAIILKGQIEFVGGSPSENAYTALRYALTYQDSNSTLVNALTDSATWSHKGNHFGYEFTPRCGAADLANGGGGAGTLWSINNGNWASTWSNNGGPLAIVNQAPRNAPIVEGKYNIAISVISIDDSTNEVRWYMLGKNDSYWYGGIEKVVSTTKKFNSIIFGIDQFEGTAFNVLAMKVDKGDPIDVPEAPWQDFYVGQWGILGAKSGTWTLTPGELTGNVSVAGDSPSGSVVAIRGEFDSDASPSVASNLALEVKGKIELVGGGFEDANSLKLGLFNSNSAGDLDSNNNWTGDEIASGYLILPLSGTNEVPTWNGTAATMGAIVGTEWMNLDGKDNVPLKAKLQSPAGAVGAAGDYEFSIWVVPVDGKYDIRYQLKSKDGSYTFEGGQIDESMTVMSFNSINIALNSSLATAMNITDVEVKRVNPDDITVDVSEPENSLLPTSYSLEQNYPNPFNPTTTIEYSLPKNSHVKLIIYDALGREVSELVNKEMSAGYYKTNFNAANLASGVYFYRIEAGDFVNTKKLMLLK